MGKKWLKLWTETLHDRKLRRITPAWRWCWVGLLMLAADRDDEGKLYLTPGEPLTDEDIADELGVDMNDWTLARDYFLRIGMLHHSGATLVVTNYTKRQEPADPTAAERMRRMRDKGRDGNVTVTDVTRNVTRTLRVEAEAEAETEPEGEGDSDPVGVAAAAWEKAGQRLTATIADLIIAEVEDWRQDGHPEYVAQAIEVAAKANKVSWRYVEGILNRCRKDGTSPLGKANGRSEDDAMKRWQEIAAWSSENSPLAVRAARMAGHDNATD